MHDAPWVLHSASPPQSPPQVVWLCYTSTCQLFKWFCLGLYWLMRICACGAFAWSTCAVAWVECYRDMSTSSSAPLCKIRPNVVGVCSQAAAQHMPPYSSHITRLYIMVLYTSFGT
jgi:hypothetical protein